MPKANAKHNASDSCEGGPAEKQPRANICIIHTEGIKDCGRITLISNLYQTRPGDSMKYVTYEIDAFVHLAIHLNVDNIPAPLSQMPLRIITVTTVIATSDWSTILTNSLSMMIMNHLHP